MSNGDLLIFEAEAKEFRTAYKWPAKGSVINISHAFFKVGQTMLCNDVSGLFDAIEIGNAEE